MKKIGTLFVLLAMLLLNIKAQELILPEVEDIALGVLESTRESDFARMTTFGANDAEPLEVQSIVPIERDSTTYMYTVNMRDSMGWVIVANEKSYHASVIAYCPEGSLVYDTTACPPAFLDLLNSHMNTIDSVRKGVVAWEVEDSPVYATPKSVVTTPRYLKEYYWDQSDNNSSSPDCERVYNKYCPARWANKDKTCGKYLAGCGAVAIAQIMRYWKWPASAKVSGVTYTFDWDNMPLKVYNTTPLAQAEGVAKLLRACGKAASTAYTGSGSAATIAGLNTALTSRFNYHTERVHEYASTNMVPILKAEIDAGRPVLCQAWNNNDGLAAHSFVIDGYRVTTSGSSQVFEWSINWGWGGWNEKSHYNLNFNGYDGNRTFLTQIYPNDGRSAQKAQALVTSVDDAETISVVDKVEVYTIDGSLLLRTTEVDDIENLSSGLYIVRTIFENGTMTTEKQYIQ